MSLNENGTSNAIPKFDCHSRHVGTTLDALVDIFWVVCGWERPHYHWDCQRNHEAPKKSDATPFSRSRQEIFSTPRHQRKATNYVAAVTALNGCFLPKVNAGFARQKFHPLQQKEGETVLQFVTQLRKERKDCTFGADSDNQIRDAVLCKRRSDYIRGKLLEERVELTLARTFLNTWATRR